MDDVTRRPIESFDRFEQRFTAEGGLTDEGPLESYGAPDKWPQAVTTARDAYEASFGQQDSAVGGRIAKNAEINVKIDGLVSLKSTIGQMVPNFCSGNPGAIAAWTSAAHVEAAPKRKRQRRHLN